MTEFKAINFLTCGHVDDGKSTLIGRMLYDIGVVPDDQIEAAKDENGNIDYALFTDGLEDERRQGITIDVAYRFFRHEGVKFRIADTPGHLEYMRNMAVAGIESDVAVILVDAIHGVRLQTVEYSKIARFFGVRRFLVAINKMDAVGYSETIYNKVKDSYLETFGDNAEICDIDFIPVSALAGDNVVSTSSNMDWYKGPALYDLIRNADDRAHTGHDLRLAVQDMIKDEDGNRLYLGTLHGEELKCGDTLRVVNSGESVTVDKIYVAGVESPNAQRRDALAITVRENVDLSRGCVLAKAHDNTEPRSEFDADILWIGKEHKDAAQFQGLIKLHHAETQAFAEMTAENGMLKTAKIQLAEALPADAYNINPHTGLFILIDPVSDVIAGVGTVK